MGFTLIELMITVTIIGVLALLATVGYARWTRSAKTAEATSMLAGIKGAQETYRAESLRYLDVSAGNIDTMFPVGSAPSSSKTAWNPASCTGTPVCDNFRVLNVQADTAVYYRYSCVAGPADGAAHTVDGKTYPVANDPWFVARAKGDLNGDGTFGYYWTSTFESIVRSQNPDE